MTMAKPPDSDKVPAAVKALYNLTGGNDEDDLAALADYVQALKEGSLHIHGLDQATLFALKCG